MDSVADDALGRKLSIDVGIGAVSSAEKEMLADLGKIDGAKAKDAARYQFVLQDAIEATEDSLEANQQDLGARGSAVVAKEKKEKADREAELTPDEVKAQKAEEQKNAPPKRKAPTLLRPGEKPPNLDGDDKK